MKRIGTILLPVLASLAVDCEDASRGRAPTTVTTVEIVLQSRPAAGARNADVEACLERLGSIGRHVRPSWRDNPFTTQFDPARVALVETMPNRYAATFNDVPARTEVTLTVHDEHECVRRPVIPTAPNTQPRLADGRVTSGVSANGTPLTRVVGNDALLMVVGADGVVSR